MEICRSKKNQIRVVLLCLLLTVSLLIPEGNGGLASAAEKEPELYARSAVLMDGDSGRILYGREADAPMPMASTTKIMTCIVALEEMQDPKQICTVSAQASAQPQVKLGMVTGDRFYMGDLLYSLMLESHNDTAVCIAESISGSVESFAALMNEKAAELGCTDTYYITPNGLDAENEGGIHHTTAAELARVMRYCLRGSKLAEEFLEITRTDAYSFTNVDGTRSYGCTNHNAFLHMMDGALSGKTGFTGNAGYCYVGAVARGEKLLIVSLLACGWPNNKRYKWSDTKKLMEYGLEQFERKEIGGELPEFPKVPVENGKKESVALTANPRAFPVLLRPGEEPVRRMTVQERLEAPVASGTEVGRIEYLIDGEIYAEFPVLTAESSEEVDYGYCLSRIWRQFLGDFEV